MKKIIFVSLLVLTLFFTFVFVVQGLSAENEPYFYDVTLDKDGEILGDGDIIVITCKLANSEIIFDSCYALINAYSNNIRVDLIYDNKAEMYIGSYTLGNTYDNPDRPCYIMMISSPYEFGIDTYFNESLHPFGEINFIYNNKCKDGIHYPQTISEQIEATCTSNGQTNKVVCSLCSSILSESYVIPSINHANATLDNGTPATCTQTGFTVGKYCPDCDTWLEGHKMIPTTAHLYTSEVTTEPTCFKEGVTTYTCACGDSYTETLSKKEHEYGKWEVKTKPTCTKAGMEWSYCLNCDNDFEREIPATGHEIIEYVMRASTDEHAAYGGDGAYITACDVCNEVFKQVFFARPAEYILSTSTYTYNGNVRKPKVTVKDADGKTLVEGQDYDVIYPDSMKLPGKYDVTVFFKGNYLGEKKLSVTIKPKATTDLKAKTQDTKTITLSWSKTTGASGYEVYKYNSSTKKYVKIKTTTSTSYKVTSLTAGTTYKFKVRAYKKIDDETKVFGGYSSVFSTATKTAKPTIKTATQSSGKVKLTWNNVSGENGYEIYYSTSKNGTYKKMSGVVANKTTYTSSKLTAGKTYYFKVRTYKTVGENKIYSAFSDVKSVKIPIVYYITKTGTKYHVDGCRSLSKSKIQISYSDAVKRGYDPCNSCVL